MNDALRIAILELLDAADYALDVLVNYSDVEDGDYGVPTANKAMVAHSYLSDSLDTVSRKMGIET